MRNMIKSIIEIGLLTAILAMVGYLISKPIKVEVKPDHEMLVKACVTGYIGNIKSVTIDTVVDGHIYCEEKIK